MKRNYFIVFLIMLIFVSISFVTNIIDPMGTDVRLSFGLNATQQGYLGAALFWAYAVMSIPAGMLIERFSPKPVLVGAFLLSCVGTFVFAVYPSYSVAIPMLFLVGVGFAMLQVVINPLLRVAGGEAHYAFFGNMSQLIFAVGSAVSPHVYTYLVGHLKDPTLPRNFLITSLEKVVAHGLPWISLYWVFTLVLLLMAFILAFVKIPRFELTADERVGSLATIKILLKSKTVWFFFVGIICYVATEQGVAQWIKQFLLDYHHVDSDLADRIAVSGFWGAMTVGCAVGLVLLKLFDSRKILVVFGAGGIISLLIGLFGSKNTAMIFLPMMGFWCSVGWPVVFSLALNSVDKYHGSFAGILCTGILGGALMPPLIGTIGDHFGLRFGMLTIVLTLIYIIAVGVFSKPLVNNATIGAQEGKV